MKIIAVLYLISVMLLIVSLFLSFLFGKISNIYIRSFLVIGVPCGFGATILTSEGKLFVGIFSSIIYSYLFARMHIKAVRKISKDKSNEVLGVEHIREIDLALPYNKAFQRSLLSVPLLRGGKIIEKCAESGKIIAASGRYWFGNKVSIRLNKINEELTRIIIKSKPEFFFPSIDNGQNLLNVVTISKFLEEYKS